MALTFKKVSGGGKAIAPRIIAGVFNPDTSYPTGGYEIASLFRPHINDLMALIVADHTNYRFRYDYTTGKIKILTAAGAEVAAATNLTTQLIDVGFIGVGLP
ncbi:MAG: hypothetical protein IBX64_13230 [Actinobacteria bacterium]|nr:hypothetical protein [Actinomycetota bacterium]